MINMPVECDPKSCGKCASGIPAGRGQPPQELSKEEIMRMMVAQQKAQEIQKAFMEDAKPLQLKSQKLFKAMKRCKKCSESKYKFVPCEKHQEELKSLGEEMNKLKMCYGLKQQFAKMK